ncbi:MAG: hypothetical protein LBL41_05640 [Bifidobacteriaceae bacterium]|jgi:hypothetical protein|nr:hypothetical protein [Bifidobacteriaceae bacterium]
MELTDDEQANSAVSAKNAHTEIAKNSQGDSVFCNLGSALRAPGDDE